MSTDRPILHLISQAHLDPVWLWPVRDGIGDADRGREIPHQSMVAEVKSRYGEPGD